MKKDYYLDKVEFDLYRLSSKHGEHCSCSLVIKRGYKPTSPEGLYCIEHDKFMKWVGDGENTAYGEIGIKTVVYPTDKDHEFMMKFVENFCKPGNKSVKVKNLRSGKSIEIWGQYVGSPYHDPSLPAYWKFIDSFK